MSCFFILVLLLQLLPIKQIIKYFFIDNQINEEIVETTKKPLQPNEEKHLHYFDALAAIHSTFNKSAFFLFAETLPSLFTAEIPTPPPNCA